MSPWLTLAFILACLAVPGIPSPGYSQTPDANAGTLGKQELRLTTDVPPAADSLHSAAHLSFSEVRGRSLVLSDEVSGPVTNRFAGAFDFGGGRVGATLSSSVESMRDPFQPSVQSSTTSHALIGALRPSSQLKIEPALKLSRYHEQWSGLRMDSPSAALGLTYTPSRAWSYRLGGGYAETILPGAGNRSNTVSANSGVTLQLKEGRSVAPSLSIDTNYSQTTDAYHDSDPTKNFGGSFRLNIPID